MELDTLADIRALIEKHLPAEYRAKFIWRQLAGMLRRAAEGKEDAAEFSTALQIVFKIEGVEYRTSGANLLKQAVDCDDGDRAAKIIQDVLGIESDDVAATASCRPGRPREQRSYAPQSVAIRR
jgi:hypothetical protein